MTQVAGVFGGPRALSVLRKRRFGREGFGAEGVGEASCLKIGMP